MNAEQLKTGAIAIMAPLLVASIVSQLGIYLRVLRTDTNYNATQIQLVNLNHWLIDNIVTRNEFEVRLGQCVLKTE